MPASDGRETDLERLEREASDLLTDGDPEQALGRAREGIRLARTEHDEESRAEFLLLEGMALSDLGSSLEALERFDASLVARPGDLATRLERGLALYDLCRFDEAAKQMEDVLREAPDEPWAHHLLGLVAERRADTSEANRRFTEAHGLAPEDFPEPTRLSSSEFDAAVEAALAELPAPVRAYLSNVAVAVEEIPNIDDLLSSDPPLAPSILGVFRGSPLGDKASMDPWNHFPSSIVLYQRNLERFARDREELVEQIGITLVHEVGHFLGLDEDDLWELGLD